MSIGLCYSITGGYGSNYIHRIDAVNHVCETLAMLNEESHAQDLKAEARFRESMQKLRSERGWSQGELARRMSDAGWSDWYQATVSRIEKGTRAVRLAEARGIARVLGTTVEQMASPSQTVEWLQEMWNCSRAISDAEMEMTAGVELVVVSGLQYEEVRKRRPSDEDLEQVSGIDEATRRLVIEVQELISWERERVLRQVAETYDWTLERAQKGTLPKTLAMQHRERRLKGGS